MNIGYILAIVFAVIWLGFVIYERIKKNRVKQYVLKQGKSAVDAVKSFDGNIDDLIIK